MIWEKKILLSWGSNPRKWDKTWRNWWQWKPGRNRIVELEIINFSNFGGRFLVIQWNFDQWNMKHLLDWPYNVRMEFSISVHCACSITAWKKVKTKGAGSDYLCYNSFFFSISNQNVSNSNVPKRPKGQSISKQIFLFSFEPKINEIIVWILP